MNNIHTSDEDNKHDTNYINKYNEQTTTRASCTCEHGTLSAQSSSYTS